MALVAAAAALGVLAGSAGRASAQPQPTVAEAQKRLAQLTSQQDKITQQYDQVQQQIADARQRLAMVNREVARSRRQFTGMQGQIAQIVAIAYESGTLNSSVAMLSSRNPKTVLSQASFLTHLATSRHQQLQMYVTAARQVTMAQQTLQRTQNAVTALGHRIAASKALLDKKVAQQRAVLSSLTAQQQAAVTVGVGGSTTGSYTGPTSTQAGQAVAFAYAQLGKPYVSGAAGPGGYDCSGLTSAAWAAAGVSIPRTSYAQWSGLPSVPLSAIQPGDILVFDGGGHVGIYVGGNMLIDAPQPGMSVEKVALSGWYSTYLVGAVRPYVR
jgi:peptidoglycan DL-endopeptidase CwlO